MLCLHIFNIPKLSTWWKWNQNLERKHQGWSPQRLKAGWPQSWKWSRKLAQIGTDICTAWEGPGPRKLSVAHDGEEPRSGIFWLHSHSSSRHLGALLAAEPFQDVLTRPWVSASITDRPQRLKSKQKWTHMLPPYAGCRQDCSPDGAELRIRACDYSMFCARRRCGCSCWLILVVGISQV